MVQRCRGVMANLAKNGHRVGVNSKFKKNVIARNIKHGKCLEKRSRFLCMKFAVLGLGRKPKIIFLFLYDVGKI